MRERLGRPANRTELVQDAEGEFHISWSRKSEDAQVEPNWYGMVTRHDAPYWQIAVQILQTSTGPSAKGKLAQRFLDGLAWYGDAVSEQSEAGKLVKFVAALERILRLRCLVPVRPSRASGIAATRGGSRARSRRKVSARDGRGERALRASGWNGPRTSLRTLRGIFGSFLPGPRTLA